MKRKAWTAAIVLVALAVTLRLCGGWLWHQFLAMHGQH